MVEGLIGIFVAFLIMVLVLLFGKRKSDPKIAISINKVMSSLGFTNLDLSSPKIQLVKETFSLTVPYYVFIEQAYHRMYDDLIICWISANIDGGNNALVAVIPQKIKTRQWILLYLPFAKGKIGDILRKGYELSLSSGFTKVRPEIYGQSNSKFDLYIQKDGSAPIFHMDFLNVLQNCGNFILRSSGSILIVERLSISRDETWEEEARELLRITQMIRDKI